MKNRKDTMESGDFSTNEEIIIDNDYDISEEITEVPKAKPKKREKSKHYVKPKEFEAQILSYYDTGVMSDLLLTSVSNIAHKLGYRPNFINYTYKEEMIGDAIIRMVTALKNKKFDPKKGNAFSYFTKISINAFRNRIKKEKREYETVTSYREETYNYLTDIGYMPRTSHVHEHDGDHIDEF